MSGQSKRNTRILIQTTIPYAADDWHVGRFSLLADLLREAGHDVTARNRESDENGDDPVLSTLDRSAFDQLWLFAVDAGNGISPRECAAIGAFRDAGGAIFATRDHMDLGSSVCTLGGIGAAHHFHSRQPDPDESYRVNDDIYTTSIQWPNFHSGSNGDVQEIVIERPLHPVFLKDDGEVVRLLPAHPHEGDVSAPASDPTARVVARGTSAVSGREFNIAVAFEPADASIGRGWAESTFHHFADYNWDTSLGCPSFVTEPPSDAIARNPELLDDTRAFVRNLASWLGRLNQARTS